MAAMTDENNAFSVDLRYRRHTHWLGTLGKIANGNGV